MVTMDDHLRRPNDSKSNGDSPLDHTIDGEGDNNTIEPVTQTNQELALPFAALPNSQQELPDDISLSEYYAAIGLHLNPESLETPGLAFLNEHVDIDGKLLEQQHFHDQNLRPPPRSALEPPRTNPAPSVHGSHEVYRESAKRAQLKDDDDDDDDTPTSVSDKVPYTNSDILCARGGLANKHPGNQEYMETLRMNHTVYAKRTAAEKKKLVQRIYQNFTNEGRKFLSLVRCTACKEKKKNQKVKNCACRWNLLDATKAKRKITQSFFDMSHRLRDTGASSQSKEAIHQQATPRLSSVMDAMPSSRSPPDHVRTLTRPVPAVLMAGPVTPNNSSVDTSELEPALGAQTPQGFSFRGLSWQTSGLPYFLEYGGAVPPSGARDNDLVNEKVDGDAYDDLKPTTPSRQE